nr:uncharacterized protein LOC107453039 [Parasteatoda tepidariorum]
MLFFSVISLILGSYFLIKTYESINQHWFGNDNSVEDDILKNIYQKVAFVPGIRLITSEDYEFPISEVGLWDTIAGSLLYSIAFVFLLWLLTPMPNVEVRFFFVVRFENRSAEDENAQAVVVHHQPYWHAGGGEGGRFVVAPPG